MSEKTTPVPARTRPDEVASVDIDPASGSVSVRASEGIRGFFALVVGAPLTELAGMGTDTLKHRRLIRSLQHITEAYRYVEVAGLSAKVRQLPDAVTVPLIEAASLEDDENLRSMFAGLLANAATGTGKSDSFIRYGKIARDMTPLEALCLVKIGEAFGADETNREGPGVVTVDLPAEAPLNVDGEYDKRAVKPRSSDTDAAIHALIGLGLLSASLDGIGAVWLTSLGSSFLSACKPPPGRSTT